MTSRHILGRLLPLLAALVLAVPAAAATTAPALAGGRYGEVRLSEAVGAMRGFVVLFSAAAGWSATDQDAADQLAQHGMTVVGVDTARYAANLAALAAGREKCHILVGDAESLGHQLQREEKSSAYFTPILAGTGQGGTLAERILAEAAANTLAGAVSIDPEPALDPRFAPCPPDPTILHPPGLPGFWSVGATAALPDTTETLMASLRALHATVEQRHFDRATPEADMLLALLRLHLGPRAPDEETIADLPLVELQAAHGSHMLAIVMSGDGGWRDLDQTIAKELQGAGVSVVGWDSLRYFWRTKTPARTAADLARIMRYYTARWHANHVALIGYSFGADVLPFAYNRLPPALRARVTLMSLLGLAPGADFEIRVTGWLGMPASSAALPALPEVAKLPPALVQCFYGEDETDTLCPGLAKTGVSVVRTPGSHHFGRDYADLTRIILEGWRRRMTGG